MGEEKERKQPSLLLEIPLDQDCNQKDVGSRSPSHLYYLYFSQTQEQ